MFFAHHSGGGKMGRTRALIGLAVALLWPAAVSAQAPGAEAREQERVGPVINPGVEARPIDSTAAATSLGLFLPWDSTTATPVRPQISRLSYDTLPSAYAPQHSAQAYPPDVADRVVTVWLVRYR
jgi:hypothetical protein